MVAFGPELGDAYIDVHANTRGLSGEIRRAARVAGQQFGDEFGGGLDDEIDKHLSSLGRRMRGALSREGAIMGRGLGDRMADAIEDRMARLDIDITKGITFGDWADAIENFDDLDEALEKINSRMRTLNSGSDGVVLSFEHMRQASDSLAASVNKIRAAQQFEQMWEEAHRANVEFDSLARTTRSLRDEQEDLAYTMNRNFDENRAAGVDGLRRSMERLIDAHDEYNLDLERSINESHRLALIENDRRRSMGRLTRALRDFSGEFVFLGRLAGSRNNFLNFIGRTAGIAERATSRFLDKFLEIPAAISNFRQSVADQGGGIGGFFSALAKGFGDFFNNIGNGGVDGLVVKVTVALIAMFSTLSWGGALIGAAASGISLLTGVLTALVAVLGMGAIGGLVALGGAVLSVVGPLGALATAFIAMDDAAKDAFTKTLKPITDWFSDLQKKIQGRFLDELTAQLGGISQILNGFVGPLLSSSAEALSQVFADLVQGLNTPEMQGTLNTLSNVLPVVFLNLGSALNDFLLGALNFFAAISPFLVTISEGIRVAAENFRKWTEKPENQERMREFFEKVASAMDAIGDLIGPLTEAVVTFFEQGTEHGGEMVTKLGEIIGKFVEWANSKEGREQISQWFSDAKALARDLADLIGEVGEMIRRLDTPENRRALHLIILGFQSVLDLVTDLASFGSNTFHGIMSSIVKVADAAARLAGIVGGAIDKVRTLLGLKSGFGAGGVAGQFASGGVLTGPTRILAGEAGPEAIVPLNRSLNLVDPSVRWLSALAQGKTPAMATGGTVGGGTTVEAGAIQVVSNRPLEAARAVLDELVERVR